MEGAPVVEAPSPLPRSPAPPVTTPLDPGAGLGTPSLLAEEGERVYVASQWLLIWWRFRKHKLALLSGIVLIFWFLPSSEELRDDLLREQGEAAV